MSEGVEASAEISSIVRNSIRTKLAELNSEIDDEVPDYILLMLGLVRVSPYNFQFYSYASPARQIGNKRTRSQIRNELKLFLGEEDTNNFCQWLFKILDKLNEKRKQIEG